MSTYHELRISDDTRYQYAAMSVDEAERAGLLAGRSDPVVYPTREAVDFMIAAVWPTLCAIYEYPGGKIRPTIGIQATRLCTHAFCDGALDVLDRALLPVEDKESV